MSEQDPMQSGMGGAADKADEVKAGLADKADEAKSGLEGLIDKAKEYLSDEKIDDLAEKAKGIAPDSVDKFVDQAAEKAKEHND